MTVDSSQQFQRCNSLPKTTLFLLLSVLAAPSIAWGQLAKPLEPKTSHQDTYAESITAVADFADGTYLLVQYFVTNVGMGSGKGACKVIVLKKGEEPYSEGEEVKKSKWGYERESQMLKMARCTIQNQKDGVALVGTVEDFSFNLKYQTRAKHIPIPDSFLSNGKDFYEYEIYVPWSRVSGHLTRKNQEPSAVSGFGAVDHSRSTTMPRDIASRWIHFLGLHEGKRCIVRMRFPNEKTPPSVWIWREGESKPTLLGSMQFTAMDKVPEGDGFKLEAKLKDDHLVFTVQTFLYRYAPLEEYGLLGAMLQPWVGKPETRTYRATLKDAKSGIESPGILSISSNYK
jgi:hypothetical protein